MKNITELPHTKKGNSLYLISYCADGVCGMDYTENLADFLELLVYHDKHSDNYDVYKINGDNNATDNT
jgi:hypothetical protein